MRGGRDGVRGEDVSLAGRHHRLVAGPCAVGSVQEVQPSGQADGRRERVVQRREANQEP